MTTDNGSVQISGIAFREAENPVSPDVLFGSPIVSATGTSGDIVLFNRFVYCSATTHCTRRTPCSGGKNKKKIKEKTKKTLD